MKVSFVCSDDLPAAGRARRHARALARAGHTVTVHGVLTEGSEPEEDDGDVVLVRTRLRRWTRPSGGLRGALAAPGVLGRCAPLAELAVTRDPPDAVHAFGVDAAGPACDAAVRRRVPFVFDAGGGADLAGESSDEVAGPSDGLGGALRALRRRSGAVERRVRGAAAVCVASSDAYADDAVARCGGDRPVVVRDCPPLRRVRHGDALRHRLGIHPLDRVVVFHGPPDAAHGVDVAISALRVLGERVVLVVIGAAWCQDRLLSLAAEAGVLPQVRVLSSAGADDTVRHLASAEVGVLPLSPADRGARLGLPPALADAFSAGLPMVVSDVPEAGELVRRARAGVVVPARRAVQPADVAEGLRTILCDPEMRTECGLAAAAVARRELNWERESLRLVDVYDRLAAAV